jgi:hypothetical protein
MLHMRPVFSSSYLSNIGFIRRFRYYRLTEDRDRTASAPLTTPTESARPSAADGGLGGCSRFVALTARCSAILVSSPA